MNPELSLARQGRQRRSFSDGVQPSSEVFASHIRPVCAASPNKSALLPAQPSSECFRSNPNDSFGMKYLSVILLTIILQAVAVPSFAFIAERRAEAVQVAIVQDSGSPLPGIPYRMSLTGGTAVIKSYLEARKGEQYGIVVRNRTPQRIGVVIAVDGRNIISGQKSDLTSREEMYVLAPYESAQLDGWRTAQDTVHRFYFTEPSDSYSMQTFHDSSAMGVIAVAAFREKQPVRILRERAKKEHMPGSP